MNLRKTVSLTAGLSFICLVFTGIILYIEPHGRVAYWANWRLWGLTKSHWDGIHINIALLFLITALLHIYFNWNMLVSYLKDKAKGLKIFTSNFIVALLLTVIFIVGTNLNIPPFKWVLECNEYIKKTAAKKYGAPPYGHAELSTLKIFLSRMGMDHVQSIDNLKKGGIVFVSDMQTIEDIARLNNMTPQELYLVLRQEEPEHPLD